MTNLQTLLEQNRIASALFGLGMLVFAFLVDLANLPGGVSYAEGFIMAVISATLGIWCCKSAFGW